MTCIIGLLDKGRVYIGGDTCGSNGYTYENCDHSKVFKVDDFIIGGTTSFRMLDLLEYSLSLPIGRPTANEDMEKFMRTTFVDSVRSCLKTGGFIKYKDSVEQGGTFLIGYKDKMWRMQNDFSVITRSKYDSVGCGGEVAIGSLYTTEGSKLSAEERVIKGLEAAESYLCGVKSPFNVLHT